MKPSKAVVVQKNDVRDPSLPVEADAKRVNNLEFKRKILRGFTRGDSFEKIAGDVKADFVTVWTGLKLAIQHLEKHGGIPRDLVKWEQYLGLKRVADAAFDAFAKSQTDGLKVTTVKSYFGVDQNGRMGEQTKTLERRTEVGAGDIRYLDAALRAMKEIRDLFGLGADAEAKIKAAATAAGGPTIEALVTSGGVAIKTRWGTPAEAGLVTKREEVDVTPSSEAPEE